MPKNAGNLIFELHFLKILWGGMPPDPPRKQVPLALAIGRRPQCSRTNLPLFHLDFQFFNLHLPVLPKSGLAALQPHDEISFIIVHYVFSHGSCIIQVVCLNMILIFLYLVHIYPPCQYLQHFSLAAM